MHHLTTHIDYNMAELVPTWREIVEAAFTARHIPMAKIEVERHPQGGLGVKIEHECVSPCPWTGDVLEHAGFDAGEALRRAWANRAIAPPIGDKFVVFYSWQSASPKTNRNLIEDALTRAIKEMKRDGSVVVEPVLDRDTAGVPGSPDIASTIFAKIEAADLFVADVSLVLRGADRASPNPNVLLELGYAAHALGWDRVVLVANTLFGDLAELPFDLRPRRIAKYEMAVDDKPANARNNLADQLERALRHGVDLGGRDPGEERLRDKFRLLLATVSKANNSSFAPVMISSTVRYPGVSREEHARRLTEVLPRMPSVPSSIPNPSSTRTGPCKGEIVHVTQVGEEGITLEIPHLGARVPIPFERISGSPWRHNDRLLGLVLDVAIVIPEDVFTQPIRLETE